mgnify:FL=1
MNLRELIEKIEERKRVSDEKEWNELKEKVIKIDEIIWSLRHGNFSNYKEAMMEIDNIFEYEDYD